MTIEPKLAGAGEPLNLLQDFAAEFAEICHLIHETSRRADDALTTWYQESRTGRIPSLVVPADNDLLTYEPPFFDEILKATGFPKRFLFRREGDVDGFSEADIKVALEEVVSRHRNRLFNSEYQQAIINALVALEKAQPVQASVLNAFRKLDSLQRDHLRRLVQLFVPGVEHKHAYAQLIVLLRNAETVLLGCHAALRVVTGGLSSARPARGRPRVAYDVATLELIQLWECYSGHIAVYPRRVAKGRGNDDEPYEPSTRFVWLALRMINPEIKVSEAMTSIKHALEIRKGMFKHIADSAGKDPVSTLLKKYVLALDAQEEGSDETP